MRRSVWVLVLLLIANSCSKDFDTYYERPSWLAGSAYEVLEKDGNFKNYLELVDKTLYNKVVKGSGSYTFFAPNDKAFEEFFSNSEYESVSDIPVDVATDMVAYTMVYNQYTSEHLGDVWTSDREWEIGSSVKKRTPSYKRLYSEKVDGVDRWTVNGPDYSSLWHNYRYLPIFSSTYFSANGIAPGDYELFFPEATWGAHGNVLQAQIVKNNIYAENGIVHEIDKVILPLGSMEDAIMEGAKDEHSEEGWSAFKELLFHKLTDGSYQFISYAEYPEATEYYRKMHPELNLNTVYFKLYGNLLFSLNLEEYQGGVRTSENTGYTLFLPSEKAIEKYIGDKLLKYADDFNDLSQKVLSTFLNAHMVDGLVWPSLYKTAKNSIGEDGEYINGEGSRGPGFSEAGILSSNFVSNGMIYNIDRVIECGMFESVYGRIILDPAYSISNNVLDEGTLYNDLLKTKFSGYSEENYTLLLTSDKALQDDGFTYNESTSAYENANVKGTINATTRLSRLISMGVIPRHSDSEFQLDLTQSSPLGNAYAGYGFAVNYYGDMIRYRDGKVQAVGNILDGTEVTIEKDETEYVNGQVYTMSGLLNYSARDTHSGEDAGWNDRALADFIDEYLENTPNVSVFKSYWDAAKDEVVSVISAASFYTVLIPTDERMNEAIAAGHLPAIEKVNSDNRDEYMTAADFINAHLLMGAVYADDGVSKIFPGGYDSYKTTTSTKANVGTTLVSAKTYASVSKDSGRNNALKFRSADIEVGKDKVILGYNSEAGENQVIRGLNISNVMGPKAVLHQFDGYMCFGLNPSYEESNK